MTVIKTKVTQTEVYKNNEGDKHYGYISKHGHITMNKDPYTHTCVQ